MSQVLFAAEADQIQATLFRVSRQRQVVGGSRLLAEFGELAAALARDEYHAQDVLICAGGRFLILFPDEGKAQAFARHLTTSYALLLEGSLTVAQPTRMENDGDFPRAYHVVGEAIRRAKRNARPAQDSAHAPTTALCWASSNGLAETYARPLQHLQEEEEHYLSGFAQRMMQAGAIQREEQSDEAFLERIRRHLPLDLPKKWASDADQLSKLDPQRGNVAYLVADGNGMGRLFSACTSPAQLKALSTVLDEAIRQALAAPIPKLRERFQEAKRLRKDEDYLPLLPLIQGGDDLFVLLPAPYALHVAQCFCQHFEAILRLDATVQALHEQRGIPFPTMSAAVVICKRNYPYRLAHERGEQLLKQCKQMAKDPEIPIGARHSAIAFEIIQSSQRQEEQSRKARYQPSLQPYWVAPTNAPLSTEASAQGLPLSALLEQRVRLHLLPNRRLRSLRELYAPSRLPPTEADHQKQWEPALVKFQDRLKSIDEGQEGHSAHFSDLTQALQALGDPQGEGKGHWWQVRRGNHSCYRHGLPDLLEVWPYAQELDTELTHYAEKEEL